LPAIVSLLLYLILSYVVVPLWQRYRGRYSRYIPLDAIGSHTTSLRQRIQDAAARFLLPSSWRTEFRSGHFVGNGAGASDSGFDDEDGEELFEVDENRREALSLDARRGHNDDGGRLSRDLEEGFKDDSDDGESSSDSAQAQRQTG
jgi:hypothetical protein